MHLIFVFVLLPRLKIKLWSFYVIFGTISHWLIPCYHRIRQWFTAFSSNKVESDTKQMLKVFRMFHARKSVFFLEKIIHRIVEDWIKYRIFSLELYQHNLLSRLIFSSKCPFPSYTHARHFRSISKVIGIFIAVRNRQRPNPPISTEFCSNCQLVAFSINHIIPFQL